MSVVAIPQDGHCTVNVVRTGNAARSASICLPLPAIVLAILLVLVAGRQAGAQWSTGNTDRPVAIGTPVTVDQRLLEPVDLIVDPALYPDAVDYDSLALGKELCYVSLPKSQLWEVPLANQREPRMYGKFTTQDDQSTIDTAIGVQFGISRLTSGDRPNEGLQLGAMAAVFTRFNEKRVLVTNDYRVGIPLTWAKGPWQAKLAYEHTSCHLGDDYIKATGNMPIGHVRDEMVLGLSRRFLDQLRLYGQFGYSFATSSSIQGKNDRYDWGLEWSRERECGICGQPFAAFDMDLRSDQEYEPNMTVQLGWQWKQMQTRRGVRVAVEYYKGKSPFGQFYLNDEDWIALAGYYDW